MRPIAAGVRPRHFLLACGLALALFPGLAAADPQLAWGIPLDRTLGPSELRLERCEEGCFAEVSFLNRHLQGPALARQFTLTLDGFEVVVTVEDGSLRAPERFAVIPPPGFLAEPASLDVEEDTTGVIALLPMPMS